MSSSVVLTQPIQDDNHSGFLPAPAFNYHPHLGVLERNWFYKFKHDRQAECCSSRSFHEVSDGHQVIMSGSREYGVNCCGEDYPPVVIADHVSSKPVIEILVSAPTVFASGRRVSVSSPPGNPVGTVSRGGFLVNHFDIRDAQSGRVFICDEKWRFFSGSGYPIKDAVTGAEVARIENKFGANKFTMTVTDSSVTPFQKALFLGLLILEDTIEEERRRTSND